MGSVAILRQGFKVKPKLSPSAEGNRFKRLEVATEAQASHDLKTAETPELVSTVKEDLPHDLKGLCTKT